MFNLVFYCKLFFPKQYRLLSKIKLKWTTAGLRWRQATYRRDLLSGLRERHADKRRTQPIRVHLHACAAQVVVLPALVLAGLRTPRVLPTSTTSLYFLY